MMIISVKWVDALSLGLFMFFLCGLVSNTVAAEFDCILEPHKMVHVSSPVAGVIDQILVGRGDHVKKGQVLVRLKSDVQKAKVHLARIHAEFNARKASRNKRMGHDRLISENDMDELESKAQAAKAELNVELAKLKQLTIRSPINGVVLDRNHSAGEFIRDEDILKLAELNPLNVEVVVPSPMLNRVKKGRLATVKLGDDKIKDYSAKVAVVDPVIDAASGTIGVRLEISNPQYAIPSGLRCKISFGEVSLTH